MENIAVLLYLCMKILKYPITVFGYTFTFLGLLTYASIIYVGLYVVLRFINRAEGEG